MTRLLALVALACLALAGCQRQPASMPPAAPALWVVEDEAGRTQGWLFGTIHALPAGARWHTPALERAIARAGVLVVEVRNLDPDAVAAQFHRLAHDDPGPPLADRLAPGPRRELAELLEREHASAAQFDGLETWAAALALARLGRDAPPQSGVDQALLKRFAARPVRELEGAADQLAIFDRLPESLQRTMLAAVIAEQHRAQRDAEALARAWLAGDAARMSRLARTGLLADPALYEALLAERDRSWAARIVPLLRAGERPLVAVGAAHMLGPDGLPNLLAQAGFKVRRIQ
jgi:hypothetical protein